MSGIINATPFGNVFSAVANNPTMQGTVTGLYEIGKLFRLTTVRYKGSFSQAVSSVPSSSSPLVTGSAAARLSCLGRSP